MHGNPPQISHTGHTGHATTAAAQNFSVPAVTVPERGHVRRAILLWQVHGSTTCTIADAPHKLNAGYALWIPTRVRHSLHVEANSIALPLAFTVRPPSGMLRVPTWITVDSALRLQLLALLQKQTSIIQPDIDLEAEVLRSLLSRAVTSPSLPLPTSPGARAIALHLQEHPEEDGSIAELAAAQHVSARTVERAFLNETGLSLHAWRTHHRMELAGALLSSIPSVESVAQLAGYQSASAFRRAFKRHHGATPREYARRIAAAPPPPAP